MKNLCLVFSFCPIFLWGQVKIDFENELSDRWEQSPSDRWGATAEGALNGFYSLSHIYDNAESGRDVISYNFGEIDAEKAVHWKFTIHHNYNPSGSNNWAIYLLSGQSASIIEGNRASEALILGVNQTGTDDSLRLYLQDGSKLTEVFNLGINWEKDVNMSPYLFQIEKDSLNEFAFFGAKTGEGLELIFKTPTSVKIPKELEYFALVYEYTSSKDRLLYFDDFEFDAKSVTDSLPPELIDIQYISNNCIEWIFSENVYSRDSFNIIINGEIYSDSVLFSGNSIRIWLSENLINDIVYTYLLEGFQDKKLNSDLIEGNFEFYFPGYKDLIFTEIMADPTPLVYLPDSEYLEIYNRSKHSIDLEGFVLKIGEKEYDLSSGIIPSSGFLAFVNVNQSFYSDTTIFYPLLSGTYVILNSQQEISLWASDGTLIDAMEYSQKWYDDVIKGEGGWSLERVDLFNLCGSDEIWKASIDNRGGTPGEKNSMEIPILDNENPFIDRIEFIDSLRFLIHFNEAIFFDLPENNNLVSLTYSSILFNSLELCLERLPGSIYSIDLGVFAEDCDGNPNESFLLELGVPENVEPLDILLTEVMFSPSPGCPEFVEIYNNTEKILNLNELTLDVYDPLVGPAYGSFLSESNWLFFPHNYLTVSKDENAMINCYNAGERQILELENMKSLPDNGARIAIRNRSFTLIDEMGYSKDLHFAMLSDYSGISLERIDLEKNFGLSASWHSASQNCNFSTPGSINSQFSEKSLSENRFEISTESFTPNNDGFEDIAQFNYNLEQEGYVGSLMIFEATGRVVRKLATNNLLGITGSFYWDGEDDAGILCPTGIYLAYFNCFHLSGRQESYKEAIVLIRKF